MSVFCTINIDFYYYLFKKEGEDTGLFSDTKSGELSADFTFLHLVTEPAHTCAFFNSPGSIQATT